jgi:hypothetical protein
VPPLPQGTGPTRQDTWELTLFIQNPDNGNWINFGIFDKKTGGEVDSEEYKFKPGSMEEDVSLGGRVLTGNVILSRLNRIDRDWSHAQEFINYVGRAKAKVSQQPLDIDGNAGGAKPLVYNGTVKRWSPPEVDSEGTGPALIEFEFTVQGKPTQ